MSSRRTDIRTVGVSITNAATAATTRTPVSLARKVMPAANAVAYSQRA